MSGPLTPVIEVVVQPSPTVVVVVAPAPSLSSLPLPPIPPPPLPVSGGTLFFDLDGVLKCLYPSGLLVVFPGG